MALVRLSITMAVWLAQTASIHAQDAITPTPRIYVDPIIHAVGNWVLGLAPHPGGCVGVTTYPDETSLWIGFHKHC